MKGINPEADLATLEYVSLDLETTGINIDKDRIVEIGGLKMDGDIIVENETFVQLINPQQTISKTSIAVHGITDKMVSNSPIYSKVHSGLHRFLKGKVIVGFNIGFDLAIIGKECKRAALQTRNYRWLDIKFLAIALNIATPSLSLEKLAQILKVEITDRHRAIGDALATAKLFAQLILLLRQHGIRTLVQAERLTQQHVSFLSGMIPKNWYYPSWVENDFTSSETLARIEDLERIDPYPFSAQINKVMRKSLVFIEDSETVDAAIKKMREHDIGSVIIRTSEKKRFNLLSERHLLDSIRKYGTSALEKKISQLQLIPHPTILQSEYIYEAIERLQAKKVNHLLVINRLEELVGIISSRDLMRDRLSHFHETTGVISAAKNGKELARVWGGIPKMCRQLLHEKISGLEVARIISNHTIAMTARATEIAEAEMVVNGKGKAPTRFAVIVLGSSGRRESLLATDQDNAIVFEIKDGEDVKKQETTLNWFQELGEIVSRVLDEAGIQLCIGGVMMKSRAWCKSVEEWKGHIKKWFTSASGKAILQADIFFDYEFAYGHRSLSHKIKRYSFDSAKNKLNFLRLVGEDIIDNKPTPLRWWGTRLATNSGTINLKKTLLFPVVATARLLAVRAGYYEESSTAARLKACERLLSIPFADIENLETIHSQALALVLKQQLLDIDAGKKPSNFITVSMLNADEEKFLKRSVSYLKSLQGIIHGTLMEAPKRTKV